MRSVEEIKKHYNWNEEDEKHLKQMKDIAIKYKDDFVNELYEYFNIFEDKDRYLKDEKIKERHKAHLQAWFLELFEGNLDHLYISKEVVDIVKDITGVDFPVYNYDRRPGDPPVLIANVDKIKNTFGWKPKYDDPYFIVKTAWEW